MGGGVGYFQVHKAFIVKYTAILVKKEEGGGEACYIIFKCIKRLD